MWDLFAALFRRLFEQRNIFRYWDGRRYRRIDPWSAYRATLDYPGWNWDETPKLIGETATDEAFLRVKLDAIQTATNMARSVFDLPPVEKGGLTEEECLLLLWQFSAYVSAVKKNGRQPPTSPASSESTPATVSSVDSVSGSTDSELEPEMPSGLPEGSPGG